ncbi:MAG: hypothetical protein J7647_08695 [Cyanobacteria bacterium SBLK]|nr:hypothetical protein [Cyanobacteria bacterium SBLK]
MNESENLESSPLEARLTEMQETIASLAQNYRGDDRALLSILRSLEAIHRQIREELFLPALPDNRRELSRLLRDLEEMGGWPYIERMRLRAFLKHLEENSPQNAPM